MKLWPLFQRPVEAKASGAGQAISAHVVGRPVWTPRDYGRLADEAYVRNAVGFRCVKLIAGSAAAAPWLLTTKSGDEIESHPLLDLLHRPGPNVGGAALFEAFFAYLLISGNTYLEAVGPDGKPPRELWNLRPDRTKPIAGPYGMPSGYEYEANGQIKRWQADPLTGAGPILHLREFHPLNDWLGLGRAEPAAYGIDRHNAASAHNKALLDNGARPSGAMVFTPVTMPDGSVKTAPPEVIDKATKDLEKRSGPSKAGSPMVLGGNVNWLEMGISPKDMDFGMGKEDAARDICVSFGVPHILIVPGQSTYNNVREAKLELWEDTILPLIDKTLDALNAWLVPQFGEDLRLGIDLDEISALEPRREAKRKSVVELLDKGVLDEEEAREALQYGPRAANSVRKVDAAVLKALMDGAARDTTLFEPLYRYMKSVGLVAPDATMESLMDAAASLLAGRAEDPELDANTPAPESAEEDPADADSAAD